MYAAGSVYRGIKTAAPSCSYKKPVEAIRDEQYPHMKDGESSTATPQVSRLTRHRHLSRP